MMARFGWFLALATLIAGCDRPAASPNVDPAPASGPSVRSPRAVAPAPAPSAGEVSVVRVDRASLLAGLRQGQFAHLDGILSRLADAAANDPAKDDGVAANAFAAFAICDPTLEPLLDGWVAATPASAIAYAARALYRLERGFEARGGDYAGETADAAFVSMEAWFTLALEDANHALALRADLPSAWSVLVSAQGAYGASADFEAVARRARTAVPWSFEVRSKILHFLKPRWGGSYELMAREIEATRPLWKTNPALAMLRNRIPLDRADRALRDDPIESANWLAEAHKFGPDWRALVMAARLHQQEGRLSEGLLAADGAVALAPQEPYVLARRINLLLALGRDADAGRDLAMLTRVDPTHDQLAGWRKRVLKGAREACEALARAGLESALERCDEVLAVDHSDSEARYWRGRALTKLERAEEAIESFEAVLALDPRSRRAIENLDWLLARRAEWPRIVALWTAYLELEPGDAKARLERAGARRHAGDLPGACEDLQRACELGNTTACDLAAANCR